MINEYERFLTLTDGQINISYFLLNQKINKVCMNLLIENYPEMVEILWNIHKDLTFFNDIKTIFWFKNPELISKIFSLHNFPNITKSGTNS